MYHKTAAVLAILGFSARFALACDPLQPCCLPLCCDDIVMFEPCCESLCCEPPLHPVCCDVDATPPTAAQPGPPADSPAPAGERQPNESNGVAPPPAPGPLPEEELTRPPATPPTSPPPSTVTEPTASPAEEATPPSAAAAEPAVAPPAVERSPAAPPAVEPSTAGPSRYTPLPEDAPTPDSTTPAPGALEDPFTEAPVPEEKPAEDEPESVPSEPEEPSLEEQLFDTPSPAPAASEAPTTPEEQPAEPSAEPGEPDVESLFGPSAASVLSEPGGWASVNDRTWTDAAGDELGPARLAAINGDYVTLRTDDGGEHVVRFNELSRGDLGFLRRQIDARETELARKAKAATRLATSK